MMIKIDRNKVGLVRVVIGIATTGCGSLSTNYEDCESKGNIRAVGFWHRHDEHNLETILGNEARRILDCYNILPKYSGALIEVEWKDYKG